MNLFRAQGWGPTADPDRLESRDGWIRMEAGKQPFQKENRKMAGKQEMDWE